MIISNQLFKTLLITVDNVLKKELEKIEANVKLMGNKNVIEVTKDHETGTIKDLHGLYYLQRTIEQSIKEMEEFENEGKEEYEAV